MFPIINIQTGESVKENRAGARDPQKMIIDIEPVRHTTREVIIYIDTASVRVIKDTDSEHMILIGEKVIDADRGTLNHIDRIETGRKDRHNQVADTNHIKNDIKHADI